MADQKQEFWRWSEKVYHARDVDWRAAAAITVGIDVGSVSSQAVILADGRLFAYHSTRTGSNSPDSATKALGGALEGTGMTQDDVQLRGGHRLRPRQRPFANRAITEIACHARGANFMAGSRIRTILDMGGQDCKVIRCDDKGKVQNFIMNDKCAAGTGRGMEVIADTLGVPIEDIGARSFDIDDEPGPVSNVCTVFAKSEATVLAQGGLDGQPRAGGLLHRHGRAGGEPDRAHRRGAGLLHHRRHRQERRAWSGASSA